MKSSAQDLTKNAAPIALALIVTIGFFWFIYLLFKSAEIPKENAAQLNILLGGIAVVWAKSIGFFYDSSASSKEKDATISAIAQMPSNTSTVAGTKGGPGGDGGKGGIGGEGGGANVENET